MEEQSKVGKKGFSGFQIECLNFQFFFGTKYKRYRFKKRSLRSHTSLQFVYAYIGGESKVWLQTLLTF